MARTKKEIATTAGTLTHEDRLQLIMRPLPPLRHLFPRREQPKIWAGVNINDVLKDGTGVESKW